MGTCQYSPDGWCDSQKCVLGGCVRAPKSDPVLTNPKRYDPVIYGDEGVVDDGPYVKWEDYERLRETLNCPTLTPDAPAAQFKAVLDLSEKGEPVNGQDLINALWWRVRNQKREIARLHATIGGES